MKILTAMLFAGGIVAVALIATALIVAWIHFTVTTGNPVIIVGPIVLALFVVITIAVIGRV